jgi:hypothetical protein
VEQLVALISVHKKAQEVFQEKFGALADDLSEAGQTIIAESQKQVDLAVAHLKNGFDAEVVKVATSHKLCKILLSKAIIYIDLLNTGGLLKSSEVGKLLEEMQVRFCQ